MEDRESQAAEFEVSVIGHLFHPDPLTDLRNYKNMDQSNDLRDGKKAWVMKNHL